MLNYRNTPHPSKGKTLEELMIRRQIRMRLPKLMKPTDKTIDREAKVQDGRTRKERKG